MVFRRTSLLLFLFLTTALSAQDLVNSWGRSFALPGTNPRYLAVATEGEVIAVQTAKGVRLYENGVWGELLPFDTVIDREYDFWMPSQTLALFNGEPWVINDSLYRHNGVAWVTVPRPRTDGRRVVGPSELVVQNGDLYFLPDVHRWTGDEWKSILPECIESVDAAAVSQGGKWLISIWEDQGCDLGTAAIVDGDTAWGLGDWMPTASGYGTGLTFWGEVPIAAGHRFDSGKWIAIGDLIDHHNRNQILVPKTPSVSQYILYPGWSFGYLYSPVPCSNRIYRLDSNAWTPVSGWFDSPALSIARWRDSGIVVAGRFLSDHEGFVGDGIATFDGQKWDALNPPDEVFNGVVGKVLDVVLQGDSLWVGGSSLYTDGAETASSLLLFVDGEWQPVPGVSGIVSHLAIHEGDLHAAGMLSFPSRDSVLWLATETRRGKRSMSSPLLFLN